MLHAYVQQTNIRPAQIRNTISSLRVARHAKTPHCMGGHHIN
jgi:hypothetical protein